jgi:CRISPR-associated protein Csm3
MAKKFLANVVIKGKMEVLTGMHIGGSKEKLEIGGVDSPVIRDPHTRLPYIPGSSLKGKMRMLLEFALGKVREDGKPSEDEEIIRIFGTSAKETELGPTRLVVRDAYPDETTKKMWENIDSELQYTEFKPENSIDRITSEANPRFLERVVKGSKFDVEFVYSVYDWDDEGKDDKENLGRVFEALRLLEHSGLGGNISRGYGRIEFKLLNPIVIKQEDYQEGGANYKKAENPVKEQELKSLTEIEIPQI